MMMVPQMAYDRAITVFSPDGRLFQVEYAREAVKRGTTAVGVKSREGVALLVDKRITSRLLEPPSVEKIFQIDDHIGAAASGLVADARVLIDRGRIEAQINRVVYGELISVEALAKKVCDHMQTYTQFGGVRPYGTALLIAGINGDSIRLFETDPSGTLLEYKATGIGDGRSTAIEVFEKQYRDDLDLNEAILLGLEALYKVTEGKIDAQTVEVGVIELKTKLFKKLTSEEVHGYVQQILDRHSKK
ncbi:MAG: archaeal proteasome endopeptidase complex subunit alpha [Methanocellales archaeon]|nr:archaeal proteasome endopeptidase complex subunit alpha [Methanocellales archaeon]